MKNWLTALGLLVAMGMQQTVRADDRVCATQLLGQFGDICWYEGIHCLTGQFHTALMACYEGDLPDVCDSSIECYIMSAAAAGGPSTNKPTDLSLRCPTCGQNLRREGNLLISEAIATGGTNNKSPHILPVSHATNVRIYNPDNTEKCVLRLGRAVVDENVSGYVKVRPPAGGQPYWCQVIVYNRDVTLVSGDATGIPLGQRSVTIAFATISPPANDPPTTRRVRVRGRAPIQATAVNGIPKLHQIQYNSQTVNVVLAD